MIRKLMVMVLALTALLGLGLTTASADNFVEFTSVLSGCEAGSYAFSATGYFVGDEVAASPALAQQDYTIPVYVEVFDVDDTLLGAKTHMVDPYYADEIITGSITYSQTAQGPVTFVLSYDGIPLSPALAPAATASVIADQETVPVECVEVPGCDVLIPIPSDAVVGTFVSTTNAYYEPYNLIILPEPIVIDAGKTFYVLGQDETHAFYKILLGCDYVWVPKGTVGPNYDEVWQGTPLPTTIVD